MSPLLCDKCHAERALKGVAEEQRRQEEEEESRVLMEGEEKEWGESTAEEEEEEGRECRKGQTACRLRSCRCPCS